MVEHGQDVVLADHAGVIGSFRLVKIKIGNLIGVVHHRQRQRHGTVELRAVFAAGIGEIVRAVGVLRVGVGEGLLVGFGQHHGHQVVRALG